MNSKIKLKGKMLTHLLYPIVLGLMAVCVGVYVYVHNMTADMLGTCKKVIVTKDSTTIIEGDSDSEKIANRIELIRDSLQNCEGEFLIEHHKMRLARLCSGISRIYVGGKTELEMKERKDRVDDAVAATKAAIEEGVVAGGGITLLRSIPASYLKDNGLDIGGEIVFSSVDAVFNAIVENAGLDPCVLQEKIDPDNNIGFDANSEQIVDMFTEKEEAE